MDGASNLLGRAAALLEEGDTARLELEVELGEALLEGGRLTEAESLLDEAIAQAAGKAISSFSARVQVRLASVRDPDAGLAGALQDPA